jgi:predicted Zn-dependent protease
LAPSKETKTSLPISRTGFGGDVLDRLVRAAARLPGRDPRSHLFLESRSERTLDLDAAGRVGARSAHVHGLAVEISPGSGVFVSAPTLDDLDAAASLASSGTRRRGGALAVDPPSAPAEGPADAALAELVEAAARATGDSHARLTWVEIDQEVAIAHRDGRVAQDRRRGRRVRLEAGGAAVERVVGEGAAHLGGLVDEVAARAEARAHSHPATAGQGWVVFAPGAGGVLIHELIGHALEADVVARGQSRLARQTGPVAGSAVHVVDDPRRARVPWRIDDEGAPTGATALVQGGRVAGTLGCGRWGGAGHARRASFAEPALPRMGATFLAAGPHHPDEVVEGIAEGVYVRRLDVAWTEPAEGKATFHVTDADVVREGRVLAEALSPFLLRACVEDLASLDRIAGDLAFDRCLGVCVREGQALATTVGAPTFRLGLITGWK